MTEYDTEGVTPLERHKKGYLGPVGRNRYFSKTTLAELENIGLRKPNEEELRWAMREAKRLNLP